MKDYEKEFSKLLKLFDNETQRLYSVASSIAATKWRQNTVQNFHLLLAWLGNWSDPPLGVSVIRFEEAVAILKPPEDPPEKLTEPDPGLLIQPLRWSVTDFSEYYGGQSESNHLIDHRWVIPNLLEGERFAAIAIGVMGINIFTFFTALLQTLGDPFPSLSEHYLRRLKLQNAENVSNIILHKPPGPIEQSEDEAYANLKRLKLFYFDGQGNKVWVEGFLRPYS